MALLDDAMAWAVIALNERFGLTQRVEVQFLRPVTIGKTYSIQAWVESADGRALVARAELRDSKGRTCVTARGTYMAMTLEEAVAAIGPGSRAASAYTEESP
jgi:acyl-CoA thioesterase FadM